MCATLVNIFRQMVGCTEYTMIYNLIYIFQSVKSKFVNVRKMLGCPKNAQQRTDES